MDIGQLRGLLLDLECMTALRHTLKNRAVAALVALCRECARDDASEAALTAAYCRVYDAWLDAAAHGRGGFAREALEAVRHGVAERLGVASCLEVGPRYLHSTGQLHKGGPNCGVFLILSADELKDIPLKQEAESLGSLAKAQASGDLVTLAERGRRVVHLHLPDNSGVTLRQLAEVISDILETMTVPTA